MKKLSILTILALSLASCGKTKTIDLDNAQEVQNMEHVMYIEYRDFAKAANYMVKDMVESGSVTKPNGGRYVLAISRITNDTMQRIDTDMLTKKIRSQLLKSGKVVVTTAIGLNEPEDPMVMKARKLRKSKEVNQSNVAKKGSIVAPDLSLSGKIIQRNLKLDWGKERVEYLIQLSLTDLNTGLALWEDERPIIKEGDDAPTW